MAGDAPGFSIAAKIRENGEAALFRGFRNADRRPVLLKIPHGGRPTTPQLARLRHEHSILASLAAPGVVRGLGIEDLGDGVALVMEYPGDQSLDRLVEPRRLGLPAFLRLAIAMAEAVEAVHRHHIIHKDIKPGNFFCDGAGRVTLIEFGAATHLTLEDRRRTPVGRLEGTLAYMSPEQTGRMNRSVDRRADLYSLGVALYELGTGVLPFASDDPLELLHSHIARSPLPLHMIRSDWPRVVSEIVMRLLAKNAEDRYQDISGLKADLVRCRDLLDRTGTIPAFTLGERDFSDELRIPQKLYGRERELATLLATFERTCQGSAELLLVSGYSGVGKSVLVGELHKQLATGARFATGKFDPIGRRIPYAPILQACAEMLRSILAEPATVVARWRQRILQAVGTNGGVLTDIIPEMALVLGVQPPVEGLDPTQSQHRFESTFLAFLRVFASAQHPLVLFLDDLQWADAASLRMLQLLLTASKRDYLLVIGAYRDNEVDPTHLLTGALADLRRAGTRIVEIKLPPLDESATLQLLGDTFAAKSPGVRALAKVALQKTEGNPFFLGQFLGTLHRDGLIRFDASARQWSFCLDKIGETMVTDNVVDFMIGRLRRLPPETQELLRIAACIGHRFDRKTLARIAERDAGSVRLALWHALREGLVVPVDVGQAFLHEASIGATEAAASGQEEEANPSYQFLHDRVHQAAYATLAEDQRQRMHLRIGRIQLAAAGTTIEDRQLFEIVNHLNLGSGHMDDPAERRALAKLNFDAGCKARDAAAHATAVRHLDICSELLGDRAWQEDYETAFQAQLCRAECNIATGCFDEAFRALDRADAAARDDLDRATALALRTLVFVSMNRMGEAIACGVGAAKAVGVDLPDSPEALGAAVGAELGAVVAALGPRGFEALVDLPPMTDRKSLLALHVFHRIMPAAASVNPPLMTVLVARAVGLSLRQGSSPVLAYFCACLAHVHVVMGEAQKADKIAEIAVRLNQSVGSQAIACTVHFILGAFVLFWTRDVRESLEHLRKGLQAALDAGDYLYACYCAMAGAVYAFQLGDGLEDVAEVARSAIELIDHTGEVTNHDVVWSLRRVVDRLRASSAVALEPEDAEAERRILASRNPFVISCHFQFLGVEKYLAGDSEPARACLARSKPSVPGNFNGPQTRLFEALLLAEQARAGGPEAGAALAELKAEEAAFRGWAAASPRTFGYRHALLAAELCATTGDDGQALAWFEQSSKLARDAGSILFEALTNELAGRHAERRGWAQIAKELYFRNAISAYARWGAVRKARQLAARVGEPWARLQAFAVDPVGRSGVVRSDDFDAIAMTKATQALSSEIVLSRLMARLMEIAIAQAGAERGFLLLLRDGELWLECAAGPRAEGFCRCRFPADAESADEGKAPGASLPLLPRAVVDFVLQAREKVVLTHVSEPARFPSDPYLVEHKPQSLLCMPMLRQGKLVGILYLENRLTADVFTADRIELLDILSTQAAISLENARLYEEMEDRVKDRTRKLEESLHAIQEGQAKLIEAERRAAVAHLESELAIARRIQTSILPRALAVPGVEIAATMETATEVGGDYYDLLPTADGGLWLGIGDVSGHGLDAGVVMLMVQSGLASLMRSDACVDPATALCLLNRSVYENVHCRLQRDDYVTLSLFRFFSDGRFLVAGAHEDIVIWRARSRQCERLKTQGTWIGAVERIESVTRSQEGRLAEGDVMVLFTDGVLEARRPDREQLGVNRVMEVVTLAHDEPAAEICRRILEAAHAWEPHRQDDRTVVVLRRTG
ncbi:MAG: AAA family ATPase [Deltaproteobacteria bacterium]|nr:AAA family ATPase [Deltaproteobacteria bacterium]